MVEKKPTKKPKKLKYHGVWPIDRPGRPNPFGCQWREKVWDSTANDGRGAEVETTKTEFFDTGEKRDARASKLRAQRRQGSLRTATRDEIEELRAFKAAAAGVPWQNIIAGYRAWMMQNGLQECDVTVEAAVKEALAKAKALSKLTPPKLSADTYRQKDHKLTLFSEQFGHLHLNQVQANEVETWILDFDGVESDVTFDNYVKHVHTLFTPYVESGVLLRNPITKIKRRADAESANIGLLTVEETAHLFRYAVENERYKIVIGRLAMEAFIGLRFSSGCRIEKKDINFPEKGILLPKKKLKTGMVRGGTGHYIDGVLPEQIWAWLAITPDECWEVTPRQYLELKSRLFIEANVRHPHNCFRHGFCSYDVAAHKNPGRTAYILCHKDQDLLWNRYKAIEVGGRIITQADGQLYQTITPATVGELARGYVPPALPAPPVA